MHAILDPRFPQRITVACVNFESEPDDRAATLAKVLDRTTEAAGLGADLVIFPELALDSWGRCEDCAALHRPCDRHLAEAERADGPSGAAIGALAADLGVHVIWGFTERGDEPGVLHNSAALTGPDGLIGVQRKLHLGIPLETDRFTPGNTLPVFETALGPIGIQICYDFYNNPELSRILAFKGARLLVNPTGRGDLPRGGENLRHMTLVRAQENLCFAASANRVGDRHGPAWAGNSVIAGPEYPGFGVVLAEAGREEEIVAAELDFAVPARWHDVLPWREWRLGEQSPITRLVAAEYAAIADRLESPTPREPTP